MNISKHIIIVFLICVILLSSEIVFGQNPDTTTYFPHHLGDVWEYYKYDYIISSLDTVHLKILKDSIDVAGNSYFLTERYSINPYNLLGYNGYIVDTSNNVYETNLIYRDSIMIYKENAQIGEKWIGQLLGGPSAIMCELKNVYTDTIFGFPTTSKEVWYYGTSDTSDTTLWLAWYIRTISSGFGVKYFGGFETFFDMDLKGAIINNTLFGDTTYITLIESEKKDQISLIVKLNQNYPNPFNSETTIKFYTKNSSSVLLQIFDITGKSIFKKNIENVITGLNQYKWKANKYLSSGIYFYLIKQGHNLSNIQKAIYLK